MLDIIGYNEDTKQYIMTDKWNENKYLLQTQSNNRYFYGLHENFIDLKSEIKKMIAGQQTILDFNIVLLNSLLRQGFRTEGVFTSPVQDDRGVINILIKFNNSDFGGDKSFSKDTAKTIKLSKNTYIGSSLSLFIKKEIKG